MTLLEVNRADAAAFVELLGGVFEHSPWVAERTWAARPFTDIGALHRAMMEAVRGAGREAQLALIRAHPELAGREATEGSLTDHSTGEQGRLGFNALGREELERIARINRGYREKFGFSCIVALRMHRNRATVLAEMERRLGNDAEAELHNALAQIGHIARGRLEKLLEAV